MEYTVLGDTVNVASRMESLNKEHNTRLLMSRATQVFVEDEIEVMHLGAAAVKGQSEPIEIYTVSSLWSGTLPNVQLQRGQDAPV